MILDGLRDYFWAIRAFHSRFAPKERKSEDAVSFIKKMLNVSMHPRSRAAIHKYISKQELTQCLSKKPPIS